MKEIEKLKIKYDYEKTWLLTAISLFMTSAIGVFTVNDGKFKTVLSVIWIISIILYFIFNNKMHKTYDSIMKS